MCNNCPGTCFSEIGTNCIEYTGKSIPELGITQGDSLGGIIEKVADEVVSLKETSAKCGCGTNSTFSEPASVGDISSLQTGIRTSLSTTPITVETTVTGSVLTLDYNTTDAISECSTGGKVTSFKVTANGKYNNSIQNVELSASTSYVGSFSLAVENCPVTLQIAATILTSAGDQKKISYSRQLTCESKQYSEFLTVNNLATNTDTTTQGGLNELLVTKVNNLETNIQSLLTSTIDGNSITATLSSLIERINTQDSTIETLTASLAALQSRVDELERTV